MAVFSFLSIVAKLILIAQSFFSRNKKLLPTPFDNNLPNKVNTSTSEKLHGRNLLLIKNEEKFSSKYSQYENLWSNPVCYSKGVEHHPSWKFLPTKCGVSKMQDRVINGKEAVPGQFPWAIKMIFVQKTLKPRVFAQVNILCSGGLINHYYILTALHCTKVGAAHVKSIIVGKDMLEGIPCPNNQCDGLTQIHDVEKVIQYNLATLGIDDNGDDQHDIAMLKLATPVVFNDYIQPACLPKGHYLQNPGEYIKPGQYVTVSGFGAINGTNHMTTSGNKMMSVHLPIQTLSKCSTKPFTAFKRTIDSSLICAGDPSSSKDSCAGDSGSPLVTPFSIKGPPRNYLVGIVSFGVTRCGENYGIYVNVACYIKWILDNIDI